MIAKSPRSMPFVLTPTGIVLLTLLLSVFAWILPDFYGFGHGFDRRFSPSPEGFGLWFAWYGGILLACGAGWNTAIHSTKNRSLQFADTDLSGSAYLALVIAGWSGLLATYYVFYQKLGFGGILSSVADNQANNLKEALYEDYQQGILSLRYLVILGGAVALYRIFYLRKIRVLDVVAIVGLLGDALVSHRLAIVCSCVIAATIIGAINGFKKVKVVLLVVGIVAFITLTILNMSRNMNTYESIGVDSSVVANLLQIERYLSAPVQGSLGASEQLLKKPWGNSGSASDYAGQSASEFAGIAEDLSANSALAMVSDSLGIFAYPCMFLTAFVMSWFMRWCLTKRDPFWLLPYGSTLYCFAELWRGFFFFNGIFIVLLFTGIGLALFSERRGARLSMTVPTSRQPYPHRIVTGRGTVLSSKPV